MYQSKTIEDKYGRHVTIILAIYSQQMTLTPSQKYITL